MLLCLAALLLAGECINHTAAAAVATVLCLPGIVGLPAGLHSSSSGGLQAFSVRLGLLRKALSSED